jgi:anti-sigma regulatory factor (Ser/Thr protein kinase)
MAVAAVDFRHEAWLYAGLDEFVAGTSRFIREGLTRGEPTLVVVAGGKIDRLRKELGRDAGSVHFANMADVGANPARIIPAWHNFVNEHQASGRLLRGIGEPIYPERGPDELVECQRHESLLNVAFADAPAFWLLCPYDTQALPPAVIVEAQRSHPFVMRGSRHQASGHYRGLETEVRWPLEAALPEAAGEVAELAFDAGSLSVLRRLAAAEAGRAGLSPARVQDLVLALNELANNSLRHGGGRGRARIWTQAGSLVCEVSDRGQIARAMADRERPPEGVEGARGLWLVNQLCDLLQLRATAQGTVARLHMRLG